MSACSAAFGLVAALAGCEPASQTELASPAPVRSPLGIVSLSPEVSRILLDLGVGDGIVAADAASRDLPGLAAPLDLGALDDASLAPVKELAPDVVIGLADERSLAYGAKLEASGVHVVLLDPRSANQVDAAVLRIGDLVGQEMRARVLAARTAREVAEIATRRDGKSRLRVALVLRCAPIAVAGGEGLIHETLELAGAENVFHEPGLEERTVTGSELAERVPEVILDASGAARPSCFGAAAGGVRVEVLPRRLATLPALDLAARVRSLHEVLYPDGS